MKGKYIIFERRGLEYPVCFPEHFVGHDEVKGRLSDTPVSAGFFSVCEGNVRTYGKSVSLGLESRPEDYKLIAKQFYILSD